MLFEFCLHEMPLFPKYNVIENFLFTIGNGAPTFQINIPDLISNVVVLKTITN